MKPLACVVGHHNWKTVTEQGESYRVCSACGKIPKDQTGGPAGSGVIDSTTMPS